MLKNFVENTIGWAGTWTPPRGKAKQFKRQSKRDGHIEETHVASTLNINDSRDVDNDVNRPFVDEIQCKEAIPNVIEKIPANSRSIQDDQMLSLEALQSQIQALTKEVNGNTTALENISEPKTDSNPLLVQESKNEVDCLKEKIYKLMDENKLLKNENNENIERINNLSFILADLQQKTKNAEQERDSVITAMRLLIAETNTPIRKRAVKVWRTVASYTETRLVRLLFLVRKLTK